MKIVIGLIFLILQFTELNASDLDKNEWVRVHRKDYHPHNTATYFNRNSDNLTAFYKRSIIYYFP